MLNFSLRRRFEKKITDTAPLQPSMAAALGDRLMVVSVTGLLAEAIRRLHANGSITQLLEDGP